MYLLYTRVLSGVGMRARLRPRLSPYRVPCNVPSALRTFATAAPILPCLCKRKIYYWSKWKRRNYSRCNRYQKCCVRKLWARDTNSYRKSCIKTAYLLPDTVTRRIRASKRDHHALLTTGLSDTERGVIMSALTRPQKSRTCPPGTKKKGDRAPDEGQQPQAWLQAGAKHGWFRG